MRYIPNTTQDTRQMLEAIGAASLEISSRISRSGFRLRRALKIPTAVSEAELVRQLKSLAATNADAETWNSFLGAGSYDHFSPAVANHLIQRAIPHAYTRTSRKSPRARCKRCLSTRP